jgi:[acyl-carrier-protein] S-malonyltransferase
MRPAAERLAADLQETAFADLSCPLIANVDSRPLRGGEEARESLLRQVTAPVRWEACVREAVRLGAETLIEVGPGRVLSGLVRRIVPQSQMLNVEDPASLQKTLGVLAERGGTG